MPENTANAQDINWVNTLKATTEQLLDDALAAGEATSHTYPRGKVESYTTFSEIRIKRIVGGIGNLSLTLNDGTTKSVEVIFDPCYQYGAQITIKQTKDGKPSITTVLQPDLQQSAKEITSLLK